MKYLLENAKVALKAAAEALYPIHGEEAVDNYFARIFIDLDAKAANAEKPVVEAQKVPETEEEIIEFKANAQKSIDAYRAEREAETEALEALRLLAATEGKKAEPSEEDLAQSIAAKAALAELRAENGIEETQEVVAVKKIKGGK